MNREIKFKGLELDTGRELTGYYVKQKGYYMENGRPNRDKPVERHYILDEYGSRYEVAEETVRQYTEQSDNKGEEIYEGHIGEYGKTNGVPFYAVIVFDNEFSEFMFKVYDGKETYYAPLCGDDGSRPRDWFTISGNIYESPELLEAG